MEVPCSGLLIQIIQHSSSRPTPVWLPFSPIAAFNGSIIISNLWLLLTAEASVMSLIHLPFITSELREVYRGLIVPVFFRLIVVDRQAIVLTLAAARGLVGLTLIQS